MTPIGIFQMLLFFGLIVLVTRPMGAYMARVFNGERTFLQPVLGPIERLFYKLFGVKEDEDMRWTTYAFAEHEHGEGVGRPPHVLVFLHAEQLVEQALDWSEDRLQEGPLAVEDARHVRSHRLGGQHDQ